MTENTKFTPGPWFAVNCGTKKEPMMSVKAARIAGQPPLHEVAICATGDSPQEMENANAHLIAAAPEIFASLSAMRAKIGDVAAQFPSTISLHKVEDLMEQADAALRKARGEEEE